MAPLIEELVVGFDPRFVPEQIFREETDGQTLPTPTRTPWSTSP